MFRAFNDEMSGSGLSLAASSASMVRIRDSIGTRTGDPGRASARDAANSRRAPASSLADSP